MAFKHVVELAAALKIETVYMYMYFAESENRLTVSGHNISSISIEYTLKLCLHLKWVGVYKYACLCAVYQ